jgi:hypothetical protein
MTLEDYDLLLAQQNGGCAICQTKSPGNRTGATRFHIDHNHATREIRGLLCGNCNAGIGRFQDDPDLIMQAAVYLLRQRATGLYARVTREGNNRKSIYIRHD